MLQWIVSAADPVSAIAAKTAMPKLTMKTEFGLTTLTMGKLTSYTTGEETTVDNPAIAIKLLGEEGWELVSVLRSELNNASLPTVRASEPGELEKKNYSTATSYFFKRPL